MASEKVVTHHCDRCSAPLQKLTNSEVHIREKDSGNVFWSEFQMRLTFREGCNNNVNTDRPAELCKACALELLKLVQQTIIDGYQPDYPKSIDAYLVRVPWSEA